MKLFTLLFLLILGCHSPVQAAQPLETPIHVLLLGDSISIAYTQRVGEVLGSQAQVVRPTNKKGGAENCAGTTKGMDNLTRWLELDGGDWDVIHFNFGLHDLKFVDAETGKGSNDPADSRQAEFALYGEQLRGITEQLVASGARLVFATTTPVPPGGVRPLRYPEDVVRYNDIARGVMGEFGVAINDLFGFIEPQLEDVQQPVNVHFTKAGSRALGDQVALSILRVAGLPASLQTPAAPQESKKVRVLILDGQNNHDWKATTASTRATLEACGRFEVDVATSPIDREAKQEWADWLPEFSRYDVVFSNYNDGGKNMWSARAQQALVDFVHAGGGLVIVHAANNSSGDWPEYNRMIGVGGWGGRTASHGEHLRRVDGAWTTDPAPDGRSGSHGPQHAYLIESSGISHPVLDGLPTSWMHAKDELYDSLRGPCDEVTVLASAYCERTDRHEPMILTIAFGKGRVFHTPMGHVGGTDPVHCVGFQTIIARGTEWAATGAVTIPVPRDFPKPESISVLPPADVQWRN